MPVQGRRGYQVSGVPQQKAPCRYDYHGQHIDLGKTEVSLSSKEFQIMKYMIEHEGEAIHRHDLLNNVWGYEAMPTTRTVDNFILDLRKKLEENPSEPKHIISVRGVGYKFVK